MMKNLWQYNRITGLWDFCRSCDENTADTWLIVWQVDAPDEYFRLAKHKPTKAPKLRQSCALFDRFNLAGHMAGFFHYLES
jgi:hypothetical protein